MEGAQKLAHKRTQTKDLEAHSVVTWRTVGKKRINQTSSNRKSNTDNSESSTVKTANHVPRTLRLQTRWLTPRYQMSYTSGLHLTTRLNCKPQPPDTFILSVMLSAGTDQNLHLKYNSLNQSNLLSGPWAPLHKQERHCFHVGKVRFAGSSWAETQIQRAICYS